MHSPQKVVFTELQLRFVSKKDSIPMHFCMFSLKQECNFLVQCQGIYTHTHTHRLYPPLSLPLSLPPSFPPPNFGACFANTLYVMSHNTAWEISPWKEITAFGIWLFPVQSSACTWLMCVHVWGGGFHPLEQYHQVSYCVRSASLQNQPCTTFSPNHLPCWPSLVI